MPTVGELKRQARGKTMSATIGTNFEFQTYEILTTIATATIALDEKIALLETIQEEVKKQNPAALNQPVSERSDRGAAAQVRTYADMLDRLISKYKDALRKRSVSTTRYW